MTTDWLKTEIETYERLKSTLIEQSEGKFVLIQGDASLGIWETYEDALEAGYDKCGIKTPFLVKQISRVEQVHFITTG